MRRCRSRGRWRESSSRSLTGDTWTRAWAVWNATGMSLMRRPPSKATDLRRRPVISAIFGRSTARQRTDPAACVTASYSRRLNNRFCPKPHRVRITHMPSGVAFTPIPPPASFTFSTPQPRRPIGPSFSPLGPFGSVETDSTAHRVRAILNAKRIGKSRELLRPESFLVAVRLLM
jgi:hypothetical protein